MTQLPHAHLCRIKRQNRAAKANNTVCVLGGVGGAIPKHLAWQRCGSDKDGVATRTCQVWPTAGTGLEDDSWESCWTIGQTYRDRGGAELTARNADSASRGRASRGRTRFCEAGIRSHLPASTGQHP